MNGELSSCLAILSSASKERSTTLATAQLSGCCSTSVWATIFRASESEVDEGIVARIDHRQETKDEPGEGEDGRHRETARGCGPGEEMALQSAVGLRPRQPAAESGNHEQAPSLHVQGNLCRRQGDIPRAVALAEHPPEHQSGLCHVLGPEHHPADRYEHHHSHSIEQARKSALNSGPTQPLDGQEHALIDPPNDEVPRRAVPET